MWGKMGEDNGAPIRKESQDLHDSTTVFRFVTVLSVNAFDPFLCFSLIVGPSFIGKVQIPHTTLTVCVLIRSVLYVCLALHLLTIARS